jgi:3',5'-cyclic AMP phosphodiesterase CpdA
VPKIIVMADLHIVPEGELSHSLETSERTREAIAFINNNHADADLLVIAGDLTDRGDAASYRRLKHLLAEIDLPYVMTLGNHDDRPTFLAEFGDVADPETGKMDRLHTIKDCGIIVLDSSEPGIPSGRLSAAQLDWLTGHLAEHADKPVVVVLHHNICPLHNQNDHIILEQRDAFIDVLCGHTDIRMVVSGHVHMTASGSYRGIPFSNFAGNHYSIEPTLQSLSGPLPAPVRRREGPGQIAVVLVDRNSAVVIKENFLDRHPVLAQELFPGKPRNLARTDAQAGLTGFPVDA